MMRAIRIIFVVFVLGSGLSAYTSAIYVNNVGGSDEFDGRSAEPAQNNIGPVQTFAQAVKLARPGDTIEIANTGRPYRESLVLFRHSGAPGRPIIINGHHAVLEGLAPVEASRFTREPKGRVSLAWPHNSGFSFWRGEQFAGFVPEVEDVNEVTTLEAGSAVLCRKQQKVLFRLDDGENINDFKIRAASLFCGVFIVDSSFIEINDLMVRGFINDGFNETGLCQGLKFRNITAEYNCDEGMSAHNSVSAVIYNAHFHHNYNGIADTQYSQTAYYGLTVNDNYCYGVLFQGGFHYLSQAKITHNRYGVVFERLGDANAYQSETNPLSNVSGSLLNVYICDNSSGLNLGPGSNVSAEHLTLARNTHSIYIHSSAAFHMVSSIVSGSETGLLTAAKGAKYTGGYNVWQRGTVSISGEGLNLSDWMAKTGDEAHSVAADPLLKNGIGPELDAASPAKAKAFDYPEITKWLYSSGLLKPGDPPTLYPDAGAVFDNQQPD